MENDAPNSEMSSLLQLEQRLGARWSHLRAAREASDSELTSLAIELGQFATADASIVVSGSLARREFTLGSDIDWTFLQDGTSDAAHWDVAQSIARELRRLEKNPPGSEGTFGTLVSSHDLVHYIGGQDDSNENTTRRILMLLESRSVGRSDAYDRVVLNILNRYVREDDGLWHGSGKDKVPRFLFNDLARYWRTMTVDFAYKQRGRNNNGFALRNIKLRLSRKLLFLAGMAVCFECHLGFSQEERDKIYSSDDYSRVVTKLRDTLRNTPLDILASMLMRYPELDSSSRLLLNTYDKFIAMLGESEVRNRLKTMAKGEFRNDETFKRGQQLGHQFQNAIDDIFLNSETELGRLTRKYGVF